MKLWSLLKKNLHREAKKMYFFDRFTFILHLGFHDSNLIYSTHNWTALKTCCVAYAFFPHPILQQTFLEEIEKTVALLVFEDVKNCPYGELLDVSQRLKTASEVNAAILTSQSHEKG